MTTEHHVIHPEHVQQRREIGSVDRHAVTKIRRVRLPHAAQVSRNTAEFFQRPDLLPPDAAVQRIPVHEQDGRTLASLFDREIYSVHRNALHVPRRAGPSVEVLAELLGHRNRPAFAIDTNEDELGAGNEDVVSNPPRGLPHRKAGTPVVGEHLLKTKHVTRESGRPVIYDRLPQRRPRAAAGEHVHSRTGT